MAVAVRAAFARAAEAPPHPCPPRPRSPCSRSSSRWTSRASPSRARTARTRCGRCSRTSGRFARRWRPRRPPVPWRSPSGASASYTTRRGGSRTVETDPALRRALFVSHYVSVAKALVGCAFAFLTTRRLYPFASDDFDRLIDGAPAFFVQRAAVGSIGRWLAFPHALEWEAGAIGVVPWLALSASASVAAARGVAGPILCFFGLMPREPKDETRAKSLPSPRNAPSSA